MMNRMLRNVFICMDGRVIDDGSLSAGVCYLEVHGESFYPIGHVHGRRIFVSVTQEQWADIQTRVKARGATFVGCEE